MTTIPMNKQSAPSEKQTAVPLPNSSANKSDTAMKARRATDKDILICSHCSQPLVYIPFPKYYRLVCDNGSCLLFREGQGNIERDGSNEPEQKGAGQPPRIYTPKYKDGLARIRENYRFARSFKIPSVIARDLRYKSRKEIEQAARGMVRV